MPALLYRSICFQGQMRLVDAMCFLREGSKSPGFRTCPETAGPVDFGYLHHFLFIEGFQDMRPNRSPSSGNISSNHPWWYLLDFGNLGLLGGQERHSRDSCWCDPSEWHGYDLRRPHFREDEMKATSPTGSLILA